MTFTIRTARHHMAVLLVAVGVLGGFNAGAQEERLSLEWLFSDDGKELRALPELAWLPSGQLVIYDQSRPEAERTLQVVDPANGRKRDLVDAAKAVASRNALTKPAEPFKELGWPESFSPDGRYAVFEKDGDILLLDMRKSTFSYVASGDADEQAAHFSPDGKRLAFVRDNDLYVRDMASGDERRLTHDGSDTLLNGNLSWVYWEELFGRKNRGYAWAPDSSAIVYLQSDESMVGVMNYVHFKPNLPEVISQRHPKPGEANPRVRAGVVSVEGEPKGTTWIDLGTYPHEYLARFQWLPDSERIAVQTLNRAQTKLDLFIADSASGEASHVLRETDDGWVNVHDDLHFLGNGDEFIWLSERSGHAHLYRYNIAGELLGAITNGNFALRDSAIVAGIPRAVAHVDEERGLVYYTSLEDASTERQLYRVALDGSGKQRISGAEGNHAVYFQPQGRYFVDKASSIDRPVVVSIHKPSGEQVARLLTVGAELQQRFDLAAPEMFSIKARDGFEMPAQVIKPRYFDPDKQYPAIVYVYAGPSAPTVTNAFGMNARAMYHQLLADNGIVIFQVDNRSAAGKSKRDANTIVKQLYGPVELNDLLDGVAWLKSQPYIDPDRVGIWGWSGGGTMTLSAMTGSGEFAAGVAVAGVTDWHYYDTLYTERYLKTPESNPEGYASTSLVKKAKDLQGRLFLVHGTYDDNVHPQNAWAFSDALIEAGIQYDLMIYPMRKHGISDDAAQEHLYRAMLNFWQREFGLE
jgi:dipeptidyl-peptidase 4